MYTIRRAESKDIPTLADFREKMFRSFVEVSVDYDTTNRATIRYLEKRLEQSEFVAWVAETEGGRVIACSVISFYEMPPKPWNLTGKYAYLSSMFTEHQHRRKGLGRRLLQAALDFVEESGIKEITLHTTEDGEPLYRSFGFQESNETKLGFSEIIIRTV